jgi:hypothetical protein
MATEYQRIHITLPTELLKKFKAFCKAQGMKPSPDSRAHQTDLGEH